MIVKTTCMSIWDRIKKFLTDTITIGLTLLPGRENIRCCRLDKEYLSNVLSENDFYGIMPNTPTFIVAQTGCGKSTLVMNTCLPIAMREKKKILFLGSRISLLFQMKRLAMKDPVNSDQMGDYLKVGEMANTYPPILLKKCHNFGVLDIYSYQEILSQIDKMDFSNYSFVIMDEAHFFISDATFNCFTEEILDRILSAAKNTRRIYFTATPDECFDTIYQREQTLFPPEKGCYSEMQVFVSDEDYSYLNTTFLNNTNELIQHVLASDTESWLIFVREKKTGNRIQEALESIHDEVMFMTAEVDTDSAEYQDMLSSETLPCRVLIATKVIDVGINIKTEKVNLAVFDDNPVEIKQMVGRKRMKTGETLNLYIVVPKYQELKRRLGQVASEIKNEKMLASTTRSKRKKIYYQNLPHPLYADTCDGVSFNEFSPLKLNLDNDRLSKLLKELEPYKNDDEEYKQAYARLLMSHFGNVQDYTIGDVRLKEDVQEKVDALFEEYKDKEMNAADRDNFADKLADIVGDIRKDKRSGRGSMKTNTINKLLEKYGYHLTSLDTNPVTYRLELLTKEEA